MVCLTVCLSYCMIVCLFYANSAAKILLFLHICKQNPKNMQNLPISALLCFILLFFLCALFAHHCANLLSPFSGAGRCLFHFSFLSHICGSFFPPCSFFQFSCLVPFFLFLLLQDDSIVRSFLSPPFSSVHFSRIVARTDCAHWGLSLSLASGSDPDTPPYLPFPPR